ncbi:MAG: ATP synthase F1 subunit gamma, partial [Planctomycetota bacterium]
MLSTKEIKQRIRSISSIKQITRAMEMVAASRLKKVESRVLASRAYTERMQQVLSHLASSIPSERSHPLFTAKEHTPAIKIVLITADKGLCGAYNNNIIQKTVKFIKENTGKTIKLIHIGKKGNLYFSKGGYSIEKYYPENVEKFGYNQVKTLASQLIDGYEAGEFGQLYIFFTKFNTTMQYSPMSIRLLPMEKDAIKSKVIAKGEYIFEPDKSSVLNIILPRLVETQVYQAALESAASEHSARMMA